jgi:large subunit ribosomal protein L17
LQDKQSVKKLVNEIAPRYEDRNGGYTSIIKTRLRRGDASQMAFISFV